MHDQRKFARAQSGYAKVTFTFMLGAALLSLLLSGCVTGSSSRSASTSPWERTDVNAQANQQPRTLNRAPFRYGKNQTQAPNTQNMQVSGSESFVTRNANNQNTARIAPVDSEKLTQYGTHPSAQNGYQGQNYQMQNHAMYGQQQQYRPPYAQQGNVSFTASPQRGSAPIVPQSSGHSPAVKVGILLPLSGRHKELGQSMLQAAQLALFDLNYANFELIPRDTKGTASGARQAAQSVLNEGVQLILGPLFADSVRAARAITDPSGIVMIGFSTDWRVAGGNTFIMGVLPFAQAERIAQYAAKNNLQRIGIIAPNNDYGTAVVQSFSKSAQSLGLEITAVKRFNANSQNITPEVREFANYDQRVQALEQEKQKLEAQLAQAPNDAFLRTKMRELNASMSSGDVPYDAIFVPVGGDQAKSLVNLLAYYDLGTDKVRYLGTGLWDEHGIHAEPAIQGAWYAAPAPALRADFENNYYNVYGVQAPRLVSIAYDATALATVLARQGYSQSNRPAFNRAAVINPNGFAGIDGIFRFGRDGLIQRGLAVHEIAASQANVIEQAPTTFQTGGY